MIPFSVMERANFRGKQARHLPGTPGKCANSPECLWYKKTHLSQVSSSLSAQITWFQGGERGHPYFLTHGAGTEEGERRVKESECRLTHNTFSFQGGMNDLNSTSFGLAMQNFSSFQKAVTYAVGTRFLASRWEETVLTDKTSAHTNHCIQLYMPLNTLLNCTYRGITLSFK